MKVFMIAGEDSGDDLGAALVSALKKIHGDTIECLGVGGPRMRAAGFEELLPMDQISVIGIWEVLPKIPRLIHINKAIVQEIEKQQPDVVVTIDFPDFNFILGKALKKRGKFKGKLVHYVAPSVWAWREGRAKKVAKFLDGLMCLFPMEVDYFTRHGLAAEFVGHPVVSTNALIAKGSDFREANDIPLTDKTLGIFFGSRESEFKKLSEVLCLSAKLLGETFGNIHVIVPTLPRLEYEVQNLLENFGMPVYMTTNPSIKWEAFKACDVVIAVSGTVALELAYAGVPHVIVYKINPITALILRFMVKVKYAHLANILLGKEVVPEFLQGKCNVFKITEKVTELYNNKELQDQQKADFAVFRGLLGANLDMPPSQKAAMFITKIANEPKKIPATEKQPVNP